MKNIAKLVPVALALATLALPDSAIAQLEDEAPAPPPRTAPSPNAIVDRAPATDWRAIAPEDLLVMTLAPDADGAPRQVIIQLLPKPFSQGWTDNIRTLAKAQWYDGTSVNRVQDNYVVQWGDPNYDNPESGGKAKPLPDTLRTMTEGEYVSLQNGWDTITELSEAVQRGNVLNSERSAEDPLIKQRDLALMDTYAEFAGFAKGWPVGFGSAFRWAPGEIRIPRDVAQKLITDFESSASLPVFGQLSADDKAAARRLASSSLTAVWPVHCYGMVGVGRNYSPDTGSGAELYTVIGQAPRHLDRNIALVGRIIAGMEHLSSLPRGSGALGFYTMQEADKRTSITSIRVASDLPESERPRFEFMSTQSGSFARYAAARANRRDPFFIVPAGGADLCNIPVPVRPSETAQN